MQLDLPLAEAAPGIREVAVAVVRLPRRRSLAIHVSPLGEVEVRAPLATDSRDIAAFLQRHRDWVLRKVAAARAAPPWEPAWAPGGDWFWRGETLALAAGGRRGGELQGGRLLLPLAAAAPPDAWRRQVFAWHRRQAAPLLADRVGELFAQHCAGHRLLGIELRWMRATWATCGGRRGLDGRRDVRLRLNPWLAALPPLLCDAVLLHELAHVEHMHHGKAFYRRLARLNPDWAAHDETLRDWSRRLLPIAAR